MADIAITNTKIDNLNADKVLTFNSATNSVVNSTDKFIYTPTGKDNKVVIGVQVADTHGTVTYSIGGGVGAFGTAAKTGSIAQNTTDTIQIETGRYMKANGTIEITFTPANGKRLATDHALRVWVIELQ